MIHHFNRSKIIRFLSNVKTKYKYIEELLNQEVTTVNTNLPVEIKVDSKFIFTCGYIKRKNVFLKLL